MIYNKCHPGYKLKLDYVMNDLYHFTRQLIPINQDGQPYSIGPFHASHQNDHRLR